MFNHHDSDDGAELYLQVVISGRDGGTLRLRVAGDLDATTVALFRERIAVLLSRCVPCIELDLREIGFCDAAGVRELVALRHHLELQGTEVVLVAASAAVRLVLHLLGMDGWA